MLRVHGQTPSGIQIPLGVRPRVPGNGCLFTDPAPSGNKNVLGSDSGPRHVFLTSERRIFKLGNCYLWTSSMSYMQPHIFKTRESIYIFVVGGGTAPVSWERKPNIFFKSQRGYLRENVATVCCGQMSHSMKPYKLRDSGHYNQALSLGNKILNWGPPCKRGVSDMGLNCNNALSIKYHNNPGQLKAA